MIGFLKDAVTGRGRRKISRAQIISALPIRNPSVTWERSDTSEGAPALALLRIPRRRDGWGEVVARLFKLPEFRKLELDEIGTDVWEMCDGTVTVDAVTKAICIKYRLNRRQGETSVTAYLKQLAERRLIALRTSMKPLPAKRGAAVKTSTRTVARKQKRA